MNIEEGDIILCAVEKVSGAIVFVNIEGNGQGTIITSEIAAGRIRNLRDYVVPKKKIVCKVLRAIGDKIHLSLRRVTKKEREELMNEIRQEKSYIAILSTILGKEKTREFVQKIINEQKFYDFIEETKKDPKILEKEIGKTNAEKVLEIILSQKPKIATIKKEINLKTTNPEGLELIKKILGKIKNAEIKYVSAGRYTLKTEAENIKLADHKLKEILEEIEKQAKKDNFEFSINEKKK